MYLPRNNGRHLSNSNPRHPPLYTRKHEYMQRKQEGGRKKEKKSLTSAELFMRHFLFHRKTAEPQCMEDWSGPRRRCDGRGKGLRSVEGGGGATGRGHTPGQAWESFNVSREWRNNSDSGSSKLDATIARL